MLIRGINCSTPNGHSTQPHLHVPVAPWLIRQLFGSCHLEIEMEQKVVAKKNGILIDKNRYVPMWFCMSFFCGAHTNEYEEFRDFKFDLYVSINVCRHGNERMRKMIFFLN